MATTYFETDTDSDLNKNTVSAPANSKKLLQTAPGSAASQTITLASSATGVECFFITEPNDPSSSGGTGSRLYTFKVNVTTANMNVSGDGTAGVRLERINSAGVVQATHNLAASTSWPQTTGVKTLLNANRDIGTFAAGDRLAIGLKLTNGAMADSSLVIEVGLASGNEEVVAPWTFAAAAADIPDIVMAPPR